MHLADDRQKVHRDQIYAKKNLHDQMFKPDSHQTAAVVYENRLNAFLTGKQRIGLLGGTFDPIHAAHLMLAHCAMAQGKLDGLLIIPSGMPALKQIEQVTPMVYRFEMVRASLEDEPNLHLVDVEQRREGPSYMVDTIRYIQSVSKLPIDVYLIGGTDILFDLVHWHEPAQLLNACTLMIGHRPGYTDEAVSKQALFLKETMGARIQFFETELTDLSSTHIRAFLKPIQADAQGGSHAQRGSTQKTDRQQSVESYVASNELNNGVANPLQGLIDDGLIMPACANVIESLHLYDQLEDWQGLSPETLVAFNQLQQRLWSMMSYQRLLHSVNVARYAMHLAHRYQTELEAEGQTFSDVLYAALLHDAYKEQFFSDWLANHRDMQQFLSGHAQIVHGFMAADLIPCEFGIQNPTILDAIRYHTTLRANATVLDQIIFLSDKIEWGRRYPDVPAIRACAEVDLKQAVIMCLESTSQVVLKRKGTVHPLSLEALAALKTK